MDKMKATEKRDLLVKEVLKPMLKEAGFKTKRMLWWKELEDGYLFIYMKNSRFNSEETGCSFCFQFSASKKEDIRDKLKNQWIYNQFESIEERDFLPHSGSLSPNRNSWYKIDGYRRGQPKDVPVEEIMEQVKGDFETYIMPYIMQIEKVQDFEELKDELKKNFGSKEDMLIKYYTLAHSWSCSDSNLPYAVQMQKDLALTAEDIRSRYDLLDIIAQNSDFPDLDAKAFIEKVLSIE